MKEIRIGDICEIINGFAFKSKKYVPDGIRIIRITNVQKGYIEDSTPVFYRDNSPNLERYMLKEGDLLISLTGNVGRVAIVDKKFLPAALNQRVACLRMKTNQVKKKYLFYFLNSDFFEQHCLQSSKGIAQKNMSTEWLKNYKIPFYSNLEQTEIVKIFDILSILISLRKQELKEYDQLLKSRFVEMFGDCKINPKGWKTRCLEEIAEVGSSRRVFVEELQETGIPFYRGTEIGALAEGKEITPELFITEKHYAELCRATGKPQTGDLLMPSICPDGRIWMVNADKPFYFKDGRVLWIHAIDRNYNPVFLLYTLKDRIMSDYSSIASGTTFAELKIFALKKCRIFDVPITLQNEFAAFVAQTDKSKLIIQKSLDELETLNKALMQKYFGGN